MLKRNLKTETYYRNLRQLHIIMMGRLWTTKKRCCVKSNPQGSPMTEIEAFLRRSSRTTWLCKQFAQTCRTRTSASLPSTNQYVDGDVVNVACVNFLGTARLTMKYAMADTLSGETSTTRNILANRLLALNVAVTVSLVLYLTTQRRCRRSSSQELPLPRYPTQPQRTRKLAVRIHVYTRTRNRRLAKPL